ncbi:MAG: hypothetical protein ABIG44_14540 [Planctomycetota bacterium]
MARLGERMSGPMLSKRFPRIGARRIRWLLLIMAFLVPANIPLGACTMIQTVPLAGWWQVSLEDSERVVVPQGTHFQSLLNIGGCNDPFNALHSLSGSQGELLDSGLVLRLGPALIVEDTRRCSETQAHQISCEPIAWSANTDDEFERAAPNDLRPLLPGGDLSFQEPLVLTDTGTMEIELHTRQALEPDAQDATWHFPPDDRVIAAAVHWESTVTWDPPTWSTDYASGTLFRQSVVTYTLADAITPGWYAYPAPPGLGTAPPTESVPAGTRLEVRRSETIKLRRVAAPP